MSARRVMFSFFLLIALSATVSAAGWGKMVPLAGSGDLFAVEDAAVSSVVFLQGNSSFVLYLLSLIAAGALAMFLHSAGGRSRAVHLSALAASVLIVSMPIAFADATFFWHEMPADGLLEKGSDYFIVKWKNTGTPTRGTIYYGKTESFGQSVSDTGFTELHEIRVSGLDPDTVYYYKLEAEDESGATETKMGRYYTGGDKPYSVRTLPPPDRTPPEITGVVLLKPTDTSVRLSWMTDEPADSIVYYGLASPPDRDEGVAGKRLSHTVTIDGLEPEKTYFYRVSSCDESNNCATTPTQRFIAGKDDQAQFLEAPLTDFHKAWTISFTGTTKPFSTLTLYINGEPKQHKTADALGSFTFGSVRLDTAKSPNVIRLKSVDQSLNEIEKEWSMMPDFEAPTMEITQFNQTSVSGSLTVKGFVDEIVSLYREVRPADDGIPPGKVEGLIQDNVYTNSVEFSWERRPESDFLYYAIYRDGVRITTTENNRYIDAALDSGQTYEYRVSAIDKACNEGSRSDILTVTTMPGGREYGLEPEEAELTCNTFYFEESDAISGHFTITLPLTEGMNYITIRATDRAGNMVEYRNTTYFSSGAPRIIQTNLPLFQGQTFERDIRIRGNVTDNATINVYLNGRDTPAATVMTAPTTDPKVWEFEVKVNLERSADLEVDQHQPPKDSTATFKSGTAWENHIVIEAVDRVGNSDSIDETIVYALCSFGGWFYIDYKEPIPSVLNPRLIIMGMEEIGQAVNLTWQGSTAYNATIRDLRVLPQPINVENQDDYDLGWVMIDRRPLYNTDKTQAYSRIRIRAQDPSQGENWTWYQKEENISNHRVGECATIPDGVGCVKLPLMFEIHFETPVSNGTFVQRECWDVEIGIDKRIDPKNLPESFLKNSIKYLTEFIDSMDTLLEPIKDIEKITIITCLLSWLYLWLKAWERNAVCDLPSALPGYGFDKTIAGWGEEACEKKYAETGSSKGDCGDSEKCDSCKTCSASLKSYQDTTSLMQWVCDRVFCPSAPTFRTYVEKQSPAKVTPSEHNTWEEMLISSADDVSDCQLLAYSGKADVTYYTKTSLDDWNKRDEYKCTDLHIPDARCCPTEYMREWDSACGLPDGQLFNELKESACIEVQERGMDEPPGLNCNRVWNAVAGFCEPDGAEPSIFVHSNVQIQGTSEFLTIKMNRPSDRTEKKWIIEPGFVRKRLTEKETELEKKVREGEPTLINEQAVFYPLRNIGNMADIFIEVKDGREQAKDLLAACPQTGGEFVTKLSTEVSTASGSTEKLRQLCRDVHASIGSGKDQVVDPTSGILRSAQCLCLPALKGYMSLYRAIAVAVRNCFQTVLITGDGSSGQCQAILTVYICDLIWDMIRCFKTKFSTRGMPSKDGRGIFSSIVKAGEDAFGTVSKRYGETEPWRAMFAERKIVHGLCLWAFTGTWDVDFTSFFDDGFPMAIASEGMVYPCERRFVSFDPSASPPGRTTYMYHVGASLFSGADLSNVHLSFVCSSGFQCGGVTGYGGSGFEGGQCDCRGGEQTVHSGALTIPSSMSSGDSFSEDIYVTHSGVRYDRAVLSWSYVDNTGSPVTQTAECTFKKTGPDEPAFCQWSFVYGQFTCNMRPDEECLGFFVPGERLVAQIGTDFVGKELVVNPSITHGTGNYSGSENNPCTKWVGVTVTNKGTGRQVYKSDDGSGPINHDGQIIKSVKAGQIRKEWFSTVQASYEMSRGSEHVNLAQSVLSTPGHFTLEKIDDKWKCTVYQDNECKKFQSEAHQGGDRVTCGRNTFVMGANNQKVDCFEVREKASSLGGCEDLYHSAQFTVKLTMFDAEDYGVFYRPNVAQVTVHEGRKQEISQDITLYCSENAAKGTTPEQAATAAVPDVSGTLTINNQPEKVSVGPGVAAVSAVLDVGDKDVLAATLIGEFEEVLNCGAKASGRVTCSRNVVLVSGEYAVSVQYSDGSLPNKFFSTNNVTVTAGAGSDACTGQCVDLGTSTMCSDGSLPLAGNCEGTLSCCP